MNEQLQEKRFFGWSAYEFRLTIWFFLTWGFVFLDRLTISFLAPLVMEDLNISATQYGLIGTATTGCFAVASIIFPSLSDRSGFRKKWLLPFVFGASVFSALGAVTTSFETLIITRALVGFCEGPILTLLYSLLIPVSSKNKVAVNTGFINTGCAVIAVTLGPIITTQVAAAYDWRMAFLAASIPTFIIALIMIKTVREIRFEPNADETGKKVSVFVNVVQALKYRNVLLCFIIGVLFMCGYWTLMLYASLFFSTVGGREITSIGFIIATMGVLCIVWTIVVPKVADLIGRKMAVVVWFALSALAPLMMFGAPTSFATVIVYMLAAGIPGSMIPLIYSIIPAETLPPSLFATASGIIIGISELLGGAVYVGFSGMIAESQGIEVVMLIGGLSLAISAVLGLFLKETYKKKGQESESEEESTARDSR
jgi:predicted MFS family arabinose efflux permease